MPLLCRVLLCHKTYRYSDDTLGNLLAVKTDLCGKNFEVKINDVIFVGYPLTLQKNSQPDVSKTRESLGTTCFSFHVLFALKVRLLFVHIMFFNCSIDTFFGIFPFTISNIFTPFKKLCIMTL